MAARENQALQVAVMIFFLLVVLLAVTTYVFFKSADDRAKVIKALKADVTKADTLALKDRDEINRYKEILGFSPEDSQETIEKEFEKDMKTYSIGFDGDVQVYRTLLQFLFNDKKKMAEAQKDALAREQSLKDQIALIEANKEKQIVVYKTKTDEIVADAAQVRTTFDTERDRITRGADGVAKQLAGKNSEISNLVAKNTEKVKAMATTITKLSQLNRQKTAKLREREADKPESPDGKVTWVNQRSNTVWINLGRADQLRRQTIFAVYPIDQNGAVLEEKKGSIEVTRILDQHMAEAKILDTNYSDPILPGDKIHSPVWKVGQTDSFALVGFMDIDDDERSDRAQVRDLISLNGGKIDLELDDDGKVTGRLTLDTRYLVLGNAPTGKEKKKELLENYSRLTGEAQDMGIETISVKKFVSQMGYQPTERSVGLGRGARPEDFRPKPYEGGQRGAAGRGSGVFRERSAPRSAF